MYQHDLQELSVGEGAEDSTATLFYASDPALDITDMFGSCSSVDNDVGGMIDNIIKLIGHEDCLNPETCTSVNSHNPLKKQTKLGCGAAWDEFNRS